MRNLIVIMMMWSATTINAQEIWQLTPWPPDSNYVLGALPSGEPTWVHKDSTGISGGVTDVFIEGDSLYTVVGSDTTTVGYLYQGAVYFLGTPYDIKKGDFYKSTNLFNPTATKNQIWDGSAWIDFDKDIYLDNELTTYHTASIPILPKKGDLWYNPNLSPAQLQIHTGSGWVNVSYYDADLVPYIESSGTNKTEFTLAPTSGLNFEIRNETDGIIKLDYTDLGGGLINKQRWSIDTVNLNNLVTRDTALISQIVSDSLATYVFETDTSLINQLISDSLATIVFPNDSTIVTNGTGISVVESPANTFTVTNTAPDQVVTIAGASGTYPNFTVTNPPDSTIVQNSYGTIITESPTNTYNVKVDSSLFATTYDIAQKQNIITGTSGQTLRFDGTNSLIANSLLYNVGNQIGIGTITPTASYILDVAGNTKVRDGFLTVDNTVFINAATTLNMYNSANTGIFHSYQDGATSTDNIVYRGQYKTFTIGYNAGAGQSYANVANKKLHVNGAVSIGDGVSATSVAANSLLVQGSATVQDRTGTAATLSAFDTNGKLVGATLGTGLSWSGNTLNGNVGNVTGSGVATRVAFWNDTNSLSSNSNLFYNNSTDRLGLGTSLPSVRMHISGSGYTDHLRVQGSGGGSGMSFNGGTNTEYLWYQDANQIFSFGGGGPSGSNKKLHVDGGVSIGASYDATSINSANGLVIQGNLGIGGNNATDHDAVFNGTNAVKMPSGSTAQRPAYPLVGSLRLNESTVRFEYYYPSSWYQILSTSTNLTQGSVLFADVNGNPTQDNSNFFWNDTNNRLGIGTSSPSTSFHVLGGANAATMQYNAFASPLRVYNASSVGTGLRFEDSSGASDIYYNNGTYSIGGGGSAVTNKKAHIDGGVTIGASYDGTSIDANSLKVEGSVTVNTRTGTGTSLTMYDASGKLCTAGLTGLTISGGNLVGPTAPETFAAVGSKIQSWNSTGTFGSGKDVGFGVDPTREIDVNGDARLRGAIYDSANSAGSSGQVLTSQGSGAWIWSTPVDQSTTNELQNLSLSGQSLGISSGTGVTLPIVDVVAGSGTSVSKVSGVATVSLSTILGQLSVDGNNSLSVTTSYTKLPFTSQAWNGTTTSTSTYDIQVPSDGFYELSFSGNFTENSASKIYGAFFINSTEQLRSRISSVALGTTDPINLSTSGIFLLSANDYISFRVKDTYVSNTLTYYSPTLSVKKL